MLASLRDQGRWTVRVRSVTEGGWTRHNGQFLSEADSISLQKNAAFVETSVRQFNGPSDSVVVSLPTGMSAPRVHYTDGAEQAWRTTASWGGHRRPGRGQPPTGCRLVDAGLQHVIMNI